MTLDTTLEESLAQLENAKASFHASRAVTSGALEQARASALQLINESESNISDNSAQLDSISNELDELLASL